MVGSNLSQRLRDRRRKIDLIDQKLLSLLNQRLRIALEIGKIKKQMGTKVYDPKREKEILRRLNLKNRGSLKSKDLGKIFKMIMKVCRGVQKVVNSEVPL
jgi:chorismate mutase